MTIVFDEEKHEYRYRNVPYPSVTQILADAGLYKNVEYYFTDPSRDRGKFLHRIIQWHLSGELDYDTIDPALHPYFNAWLKFQDEAGYVSETCEKMLVNDSYRFAGTIDHIGHLDGHYCLIDVKTGSPHPAHALQTAGYSILMKHPRVKRFALYLTVEGKYKLVEHKDSQDMQIFKALVAIYYWKANHNLNRR